MIPRAAVVLLVILVAYGVVRWAERRPGQLRPGLGSGITVITGPGCGICATLIETFSKSTPDLDPVFVDIADERAVHLGVRSLPTVFVVDSHGDVKLRRSGRSTLTDFHEIMAAAQAGA